MNEYDLDTLPARWELLTPHRDRVVATLRRRHVEYSEAEDVVHEAMVRLVQWDGLDPDHARGALLTVAQRVAVDRHRRSGRERRAVARCRVQDGQQPDEIALDRLEARHLAGVVATLSWRERRALEGRAAGMAPRETAARSGVPARSVHLALSRARATLRAAAAGSWAVLLEWMRRSSVHRVAQPA
ncbi:MAG: sigma-70 family RNA polymerase sigma factor, partial [Candidatus Dormibacteraeota bacterium]|nr:sigma-70 family RNA polymerase sigma factor [Candidatus Dormibacteraeota bacterium]